MKRRQYTTTGYENINEKLRDGKEDEYEKHLNNTLDKLPNFQDVVYRGANLTPKQIDRYLNSEKKNLPITEKAFTSTTTSIYIANLYGNTIFSILSKTGKKIEALSCYGTNSPQNEREVLFKSNTKFSVLEVEKTRNKFKITLEEIVS